MYTVQASAADGHAKGKERETFKFVCCCVFRVVLSHDFSVRRLRSAELMSVRRSQA